MPGRCRWSILIIRAKPTPSTKRRALTVGVKLVGSFLGNLLGRFGASASTPSVEVAIFGKHPAAADHFEYLPPGDDVIREVWNLIYRRSMEELLASWNNLTPTAQLSEFNHIWLWRRGSNWVAGRMWSSVDAGGRAYFPPGCMRPRQRTAG